MMSGKARFRAVLNHHTAKNGFMRKYGKLYVVELDALLAIVPDQFKSIVQGSVDQFFDREDVLADHQPDMVDKIVQGRIRFI